MNQVGSFTKSASALVLPSSSTLNGYAHFTKISAPISDPSTIVLPPHMQSPSYAAAHASKPDIDSKVIDVNDLEEGVKLTILSDIERDQRLNQFKETIEKLENKRKQDHIMFDRFIKKAKENQTELEEKYGTKCLELLKLQKEQDQLKEKLVDAQIEIDGFKYKENDLRTLLAIKNREIDDLKELMRSNELDVDSFIHIMHQSDLDPDLKRNPEENDEFNDEDKKDDKLNQDLLNENKINRYYTKKAVKIVTDPNVLVSLNRMAANVYSYKRQPFCGIQYGDLFYAFYYGKVNTGGVIGMTSKIVLSSDKKVYNISNLDAVVEMNWNQDTTTRGKKRGLGHIYLGKLTGDKGFETNLTDVFVNELGIHL